MVRLRWRASGCAAGAIPPPTSWGCSREDAEEILRNPPARGLGAWCEGIRGRNRGRGGAEMAWPGESLLDEVRRTAAAATAGRLRRYGQGRTYKTCPSVSYQPAHLRPPRLHQPLPLARALRVQTPFRRCSQHRLPSRPPLRPPYPSPSRPLATCRAPSSTLQKKMKSTTSKERATFVSVRSRGAGAGSGRTRGVKGARVETVQRCVLQSLTEEAGGVAHVDQAA
ncbi:hypothetical protein AAT19DRAFT_16374 [Rhodotorula toruloides]|uniref:Uncharacterized protein n=1 Tax=Rhodotorula toruloides TaxID=5286 RepID=A0A2T0A373_RHOTO|nr:hypothetical protein AAT19DRAFT_16374 [Rhodotorula toruloides]